MLQEQFPNLTELYGVGPLSGYLGGQQLDAARRSQGINQQSALQDMYQKEQMLPIDMAMKQAQTRNYDASTSNMGETTRSNKFKNDMNDRTKEEQYQSMIKRLAAETNDDELKATKAQIEQLAINPETRAVGEQLLRGFKDIFAERERITQQQAKEESLARIRAEETRTTNAAKPSTKTSSKSMEQLINEAKSARERYSKLIDAAKQAELSGNADLAESYYARAEAVRPQAEAELQLMPKPGSVDLSQMGGAKSIPVVPKPDIAPGNKSKDTGQPLSFASEAEADKALAEKRIKPGDSIIINGRQAKVQ